MKKNVESKATENKATESKKEYKDLFKSILNDADEVISKAKKNGKGNMTSYELSEGIYFNIVDTDGDRDLASLNIYGVSIILTIIGSEKGTFISYPSYKNKAGEYKQNVTNYSKSLNDLLKLIVKAHYEE